MFQLTGRLDLKPGAAPAPVVKGKKKKKKKASAEEVEEEGDGLGWGAFGDLSVLDLGSCDRISGDLGIRGRAPDRTLPPPPSLLPPSTRLPAIHRPLARRNCPYLLERALSPPLLSDFGLHHLLRLSRRRQPTLKTRDSKHQKL